MSRGEAAKIQSSSSFPLNSLEICHYYLQLMVIHNGNIIYILEFPFLSIFQGISLELLNKQSMAYLSSHMCMAQNPKMHAKCRKRHSRVPKKETLALTLDHGACSRNRTRNACAGLRSMGGGGVSEMPIGKTFVTHH
jgi:hypothetical protein